ncbi:MAG: sulfite exporter TauE/SafE family protein [Phycisphaerae bacterium]|nr:sulfite exporter TauE/SafE family protein [Phycisphaerae bacterium]
MIPVLLGALLVGLSLGLLGSGGSILTVPVLRYLLHHAEKVAIAESLGIVCAIALASAVPYALQRLLDWRSVLLFGLPGMVGTFCGAWLARFIPGAVQLLIFALVMLWAARMMWRQGSQALSAAAAAAAASASVAPPRRDEVAAPRAAGRIALEGVSIGALTGVVGVGGGFLIVPALVILGGLPMRRAVGTSLAIITLQSGTGFAKHLSVLQSLNLSVDWRAIGAFIAVGVVGSLIGKVLNAYANQDSLKRGFAVLLVVMGLFVLAKEGAALAGAAR